MHIKISKLHSCLFAFLPSIIIALSQDGDEVITKYSVFAYQCKLAPPHDQTHDIIKQGDNLGVCVETLSNETFIANVLDLKLIQQDNNNTTTGGVDRGNPCEAFPIYGGVSNIVTEFTCQLFTKNGKNNEGTNNSKCFIETAMLSKFFLTELDVYVIGEVDLKFREPESNDLMLSELYPKFNITDWNKTIRVKLANAFTQDPTSTNPTSKLASIPEFAVLTVPYSSTLFPSSNPTFAPSNSSTSDDTFPQFNYPTGTFNLAPTDSPFAPSIAYSNQYDDSSNTAENISGCACNNLLIFLVVACLS